MALDIETSAYPSGGPRDAQPYLDMPFVSWLDSAFANDDGGGLVDAVQDRVAGLPWTQSVPANRFTYFPTSPRSEMGSAAPAAVNVNRTGNDGTPFQGAGNLAYYWRMRVDDPGEMFIGGTINPAFTLGQQCRVSQTFFRYRRQGANSDFVFGSPLVLGLWYSFGIDYDGATVDFYVNGSLFGSNAFVRNVSSPQSVWHCGQINAVFYAGRFGMQGFASAPIGAANHLILHRYGASRYL